MRIAYSNRLTTVDAVSLTLFPSQNRRVARSLNDFGTLAAGDLQRAIGLTQVEYEDLTMIPLGRKFGRSGHPQALSRFLQQSVSNQLRWCPLCLAETPYYRLLWRFLHLEGCPTHRSRLLDACPKCGVDIAIYRAPFDLSRCPECKHSLLDCNVTTLSEQEEVLAATVQKEMEYLLTPNKAAKLCSAPISIVGCWLQSCRIEYGLTANDIVQQSNLTLTAVEGIERGNVTSRGAVLRDYLDYADLLGVHLSALLMNDYKSDESRSRSSRATRLRNCLRRVNAAVEQLCLSGEQVSQRAVADLTGISRHTLRKYPELVSAIKKTQPTKS